MNANLDVQQESIEGPIPVILVVDDIQTNIQVVGQILNENGYEVMPATSAAQAFERIKTQMPDLILLDFMMPEVNGLEVCRRLKADPATARIPVIFLTASNETEHVVQAFEAGAVDFVTKPFRAAELLARVRTHLELTKARQDLEQYGKRLHELNEEKNEFLGIVAHDLRSPLSNIISSASMALEDISDPAQTRDFIDIMHQSAQHMLHLVENLMDVNAIEQGKVKIEIVPCELSEIVRGIVQAYQRKADAKEQELVLTGDEESLIAMTDPHATIQVFDNLISNALKYSAPGKRVEVRLTQNAGRVRCEVRDQGPGLTPDDQKKLFGKFARLSARPTGGEPSTGLGLSIVKRMVEAAGGKVWCESQPGKGAVFIVELKGASIPHLALR